MLCSYQMLSYLYGESTSQIFGGEASLRMWPGERQPTTHPRYILGMSGGEGGKLTLQGKAEELVAEVGRPALPAALLDLRPCPPHKVLAHLVQQGHEAVHHLRRQHLLVQGQAVRAPGLPCPVEHRQGSAGSPRVPSPSHIPITLWLPTTSSAWGFGPWGLLGFPLGTMWVMVESWDLNFEVPTGDDVGREGALGPHLWGPHWGRCGWRWSPRISSLGFTLGMMWVEEP